MKLIGLKVDRECYDASNVLKQAGVRFEYVEIGASAENMIYFTHLRDTRPEFDVLKAQGFVGLPCFLMEDGRILFDENEVITEFEEAEAAETISA